MGNIFIKICGITTAEMAYFCGIKGADAIGIVCVPTSKRFAETNIIKEMVLASRESHTKPILVFMNATYEMLINTCQDHKINWVQLHDEFSQLSAVDLPDYYHRIYVFSNNRSIKYIQHILITTHADAKRDFILIDNHLPGLGQVFDWDIFKNTLHKSLATLGFRWLLAGGLKIENIKTALKSLLPDGIDISSGVENSSQKKDYLLIENFIRVVRGNS